MARGKVSLAHRIHCCANFLFLFHDHRPYIVNNMCVCVHIYIYISTYLTAKTFHIYYRCYQVKLRVKFIYTNLERCEMWLDIYYWGAGLSVNGRIHGIGQKVLQPCFQTGSRTDPPVTSKFTSLSNFSRRPLLE